MILAISHLLEQMWALAQMNLWAPSKYQGPMDPLGFGSRGLTSKWRVWGPRLRAPEWPEDAP